ncbi:MAG: hypothetical protein ABI999_06100 [Acidobacteriota bacterium]
MLFKTIGSRVCLLLTLSLTNWIISPAQGVHGTLVVAVPVNDGLVVCADKRLFNDATGTFDDTFIKVRKVNSDTLFVATNTIGFLNRSTGKMEFDAFEITSNYAKKHAFNGGQIFWDGLKAEIKKQMLAYLDKRKYADWPATDAANNRLLFNLVFYSVGSDRRIRSYSVRVFYEKAQTPVVDIPEVIAEEVRTPQLTGKGKSVMAYLSLHPELVHDPAIGRFDESIFDVKKTTPLDAVNFASKLFLLTNSALPGAEVSSTHDCAMLGYQSGFQWIDGLGQPIVK